MTTQVESERIDVPTILTQAEVKDFVRDGYLIKDGLVTEGERAELMEDIVRLARGEYPCENLQPASLAMSDREVLKNILCIHQPHYVSPVMRKYVGHPKVCGVLSQVTGAHLAGWDGSVKCMQSMVFVKPPGFQGQAWHQDEVYIPTRDRSLIGAWIALDDATIENGCLWVIPGSHRMGYMYPQRKHEREDEWDFSLESYGFEESEKVAVEVKAGTVVFFNGYLLHCSLKNRSADSYRRVLVNHYMNAWSLLPWTRTGEEKSRSVASADVRKVVPVAGVDPYAWKGIEQPQQEVWLRMCKANSGEGDKKAK